MNSHLNHDDDCWELSNRWNWANGGTNDGSTPTTIAKQQQKSAQIRLTEMSTKLARVARARQFFISDKSVESKEFHVIGTWYKYI